MEIQSSIIKTLSFFNLFNHPLTNFELRQLLYTQEPVDFFTVLKEAELLKPKIQEQDGFFSFGFAQDKFLSDHSRASAQKRQERVIDNDKKLRIAQKAARLISWVPFVKLIAVCNTLSFGAAEEKSDIDFFIIAQKGRIWTVRFFVMAILSLLRLRRRSQRIKNLICLSFYLADDNLDLQSIALPKTNFVILNEAKRSEESIPDIYLIYWITQLVPLINRDQTLEKFWQANLWVKNYLANFSFTSQLPDYREIKIPAWDESWRRWLERAMSGYLGNWCEKIFRFGQYARIHSRLAQKINIGDQGVVINEGMIKLHESERRDLYRQRWIALSQRYEK